MTIFYLNMGCACTFRIRNIEKWFAIFIVKDYLAEVVPLLPMWYLLGKSEIDSIKIFEQGIFCMTNIILLIPSIPVLLMTIEGLFNFNMDVCDKELKYKRYW